jgi:hypothetical protein
MNASRISKGLLLGLALTLAVSAFAANKGSLQVNDLVSVSGSQLAKGSYTVKWDGNGPDVQLNILQGNKVVATTPAKLVALNQSANESSAVVRLNSDGSRSLSEIRFGGKKYALHIGAESGASEMSESSK